jgi:hypothetical protein
MDLLSDSSDDDDDDDDTDDCKTHVPKQQRGQVTLVSSTDSSALDCLVRTQPHVRGNWAGHVYIQCSGLAFIRDNLVRNDLIPQLEEQGYIGPLIIHDDLHMSLYRHSFYLQLASIEPFVKALQERFQYESAIVIATSCSSKLLCLQNESCTRTFYALPIQSSEALLRFHTHVTSVLSHYSARQPGQQMDESTSFCFHVSLASIPNNTATTTTTLDSNATHAPTHVSVCVPQFAMRVTTIQIRFGTTKYYQIGLPE